MTNIHTWNTRKLHLVGYWQGLKWLEPVTTREVRLLHDCECDELLKWNRGCSPRVCLVRKPHWLVVMCCCNTWYDHVIGSVGAAQTWSNAWSKLNRWHVRNLRISSIADDVDLRKLYTIFWDFQWHKKDFISICYFYSEYALLPLLFKSNFMIWDTMDLFDSRQFTSSQSLLILSARTAGLWPHRRQGLRCFRGYR